MTKRVYIELSNEWVLSHRGDPVLPAEAFAKTLAEKMDCKIVDKALSYFYATFESDAADNVDKDRILTLFSDQYGLEALDALKVTIGAEGDDLFDDINAESLTDEDIEKAQKANTSALDKVLNELRQMAGTEELLALAEELARLEPSVKSRHLEDVMLSRCYLVAISEGCGYSRTLKLMCDLFDALGFNVDSSPTEFVLPEPNGKPDVLEHINSRLENMSYSYRRLVSLDISNWINKTDTALFKDMLKTIAENHSNLVVFFRVPFVERETVEGVCASIKDILNVKIISFPPATQKQVMNYVRAELATSGFDVQKAALDKIWERINDEKSDGSYYGMKTVKKVVDELIYDKLLKCAGGKSGNIITGRDADMLLRHAPAYSKSGWEMLDELVGVDDLKQQVREIIAQIHYAKLNNEKAPCIHMRFVGNPGTGKTTVARIIGRILKESGVLRVGNFVEIRGRDLCGRYIGETAPKTASICRDAFGSVLFIDEAYSLYHGENDVRDFGREALDTLIAEMENHRDDMLVIMAGYTDDMERLMEGNRGLRSRMPYTIEFLNFSREQLRDIFMSMLKRSGPYTDDLKEAAEQYFLSLPEGLIASSEFSNARFVRNLYERVWAKAATRAQILGDRTVTLTLKDFQLATAEKDFALDIPKKARMGFYL